ncbi:hypothetical protein PINS_up024192 [Pythium insidiosum]|nr:hypothetical protein PINS_up024192 [Pythium insidiosum]
MSARTNDAMPSLPLGAVRTDDGQVVIPSSRRADGSMRKQIRVRQGYVPQDEVPKYKPIGQRLREQAQRDQKQHGR